MEQKTLFAVEDRSNEAHRDDAVAIRSGRVGPVRFGSTEASFTLTGTVLAELAALSDELGADADQRGSS